MAKRPRRLDAEQQLAADMLELMGYSAFHRFLYTIIVRSGISASSAYGSEVATSYHEGRRSLGIDILRLADDALTVHAPDGLPLAAMQIAIAEAMRSQTQEDKDADPNTDETDDDFAIERR